MDTEEEDLYYSSGGDRAATSHRHKHYKILKEEAIRQLQDTDISTVSSVLSISRGVACTLLCRNNWSLSSVYDEWFADDNSSNREPVGILGKRKSRKQACNICYEKGRKTNMVSAACGHPFCTGCWKSYITTSINDGPGCLALHYPEPECKAIVGLDMVDRLVSGDDREKYYRYLCRSYVEGSWKRKWCPAPGCDSAIELDAGECEFYDVTCDCSHSFCWKCTEENHRPVDCKTVANWIEKNSSEAENTNWILAYTKPCPKCKQAIEKNRGCNHMTCRKPCLFQFCWLCLGPWEGHKNCNIFKDKVGRSSDEKSRINAKKHLNKYAHYYERWNANDKSKKAAVVELNRARNEYVGTLSVLQEKPDEQLQFVTQAWEQIVECRRVLKWTYAYGYYLNSRNKKKFFEFLQGEAEAALERLHHCAEMETEMDKYLHSHEEDFMDFRSKLSGLTVVTRNYFENLVRALEINLCEVETRTSRNSKTKKTNKSSSKNKK